MYYMLYIISYKIYNLSHINNSNKNFESLKILTPERASPGPPNLASTRLSLPGPLRLASAATSDRASGLRAYCSALPSTPGTTSAAAFPGPLSTALSAPSVPSAVRTAPARPRRLLRAPGSPPGAPPPSAGPHRAAPASSTPARGSSRGSSGMGLSPAAHEESRRRLSRFPRPRPKPAPRAAGTRPGDRPPAPGGSAVPRRPGRRNRAPLHRAPRPY